MQNKYLIKIAQKFWFWYWRKLMNGFAPSDSQGNYKRPKGIRLNSNYDINKENRSIYLLIGKSCPWCHRTLLVYKIKNLFQHIKVIFLRPDIEHGEWVFEKKFKECNRLHEFYKKANKNSIFRATLPLLISFENNEINVLSNESSDIIQLLNSIKKESIPQSRHIKNCNQEILDLIHYNINDGVYKCGFARNQASYERASKSLFSALSKIESKLNNNKSGWICGENLTYADIYLFPTLVRWELVYSKLFKCTEKDLLDFQNIFEWRLKFFAFLNVNETCFENEWKEDYYKALFPLNPNQIRPILPSLKKIINIGA